MFHQPLTPVDGSLLLSFLIALLPIVTVLVILGVLRRAAWEAALAGLAVAILVAVTVWGMPLGLALKSVSNGAVFAVWPVMWIVVNALLLYNIAVASGRFDAFRAWILENLPNDRRVVLVVIGFCFGALLEGIAGFGAPVAITASLMIMVGFAPLDALVFVLVFDTTPVAFGALGVPVTVLSAVTGLAAPALAAMIGRQLPLLAAILPFYVIAMYGGMQSVRAIWPLLAVAGGSFGFIQFVVSNYLDYTLTDVAAALGSLLLTLLFLKAWKPALDPKYQIVRGALDPQASRSKSVSPWQGWLPWVIASVTVILWGMFKVERFGQKSIPWPGLDKAVAITLYHDKPYVAVWSFQPLATGTAIFVAAMISALVCRLRPARLIVCIGQTFRQLWLAIVTVMLIVALAYLMNYSGLAYTLGLAVASSGPAFVLFSPFLGWIAVFLSGSDTSGNALFGNLQVVAARQLHLSPLLFAATNSSGGVLAKMISPQNIATGLSVTKLKGHEGAVIARTFWHSVLLTLILVAIVALEQYVLPRLIPPLEGRP